MSTLLTSLSAIESPDFRHEVNQAAGTRAFRELVRASKPFIQLSQLIRSNPAIGFELLERVNDLVGLDTDFRYESHYDAAIAAYLVILDVTSSPYVRIAASSLTTAPRFWWAAKIAREIDQVALAKGTSAHASTFILDPSVVFVYPQGASTGVKDVHIWRASRNARSAMLPIQFSSRGSPFLSGGTDGNVFLASDFPAGQAKLWGPSARFFGSKSAQSEDSYSPSLLAA